MMGIYRGIRKMIKTIVYKWPIIRWGIPMLLSHESRLFEHSLQIDLLQKQVKSLMDEIADIKGERNTSDSFNDFLHMPEPPTLYGKRILWETSVQLAAKDFLREGDCVIDVGANIGGVAIAFSRMVGPTGLVYAFEANSLILPRLKRDLEINGATNVKIIPKAVWSTSGELLPFYCEISYYSSGSGCIRKPTKYIEILVETISLDDFFKQQKIIPRLIKMDTEGAEIWALKGAAQTIENHRPIFILEYSAECSENEDPLEYLKLFNYTFWDVNLYTQVDRDFYRNFAKPPVVNVLCLPREEWEKSSYRFLNLHLLSAMELNASVMPHSSYALVFEIDSSRYVAVFDFEGDGKLNAALSVNSKDETLAYYEGNLQILKSPASSHVVFEINDKNQVTFSLIKKSNETILFRGFSLYKVILAYEGVKR
jgi:FkbM family methyltransferase